MGIPCVKVGEGTHTQDIKKCTIKLDIFVVNICVVAIFSGVYDIEHYVSSVNRTFV